MQNPCYHFKINTFALYSQIMNIHQQYSLKKHNTFGVDALAAYFAEVTSIEELKELLTYAKEHLPSHLPLLFLGGGSNLLLTQDFEGLVIQLSLKGISEEKLNDDEVLVLSLIHI